MMRTLIIVALSLVAFSIVSAQSVPQTINYQGRLTDNSPQQNPVNATVSMVFGIFSAPTGGSAIWTESWGSVLVTNGIFSVLLGSNGTSIPASVFTGGTTRYLEVTVNGETQSPRQQIGSVGYSNQTEKAADSAMLGGIADTGWQRALTGDCTGNEFLFGFDQSGSPNCATPAGTTYSAGTGLDLTGSVFSTVYGSTAGTSTQGNDSRLDDWTISGTDVVRSTGNVGIGTSGAPAAKLDVNGAASVTGKLNADGGLDRSTAAALSIGAANATAVNITPATNANGGLQIGSSGTSISKSTRYNVSFSSTTMPANVCTDFVIAVSSETAGAECAVGPPGPGVIPAGGLTWNCYVFSSTQALMRVCNVLTSSVTLAAGTWHIRVFTP